MDAALDLRSLLRLLYLTTPRSEVLRRRQLARLGEELAISIELASRPQRVGVAAAINRADRVCRELGEVIGDATAVDLVGAAVKRMGRKTA